MKFNRKYSVGENVSIGANVKIGDRTVIYDNVSIGDNTVIANDCIIGEPWGNYYSQPSYENPNTIIGSNCLVRSHSIIYSGSEFGNHFATGHRVTIRENSKFGKHCSIGTLSDIQGYVKFGDYCRLHSNVHIGQKSELGNFVFVYPYVVFTNDPHPPSNICIGPKVDDFAQIAVFSVLLPGVKVGKHALVGAGSIVSRDVEDYALVLGNPANKVKDVREIKSKENSESHYPWPFRFDRGMPWAGIGYDEWTKNKNQ